MDKDEKIISMLDEELSEEELLKIKAELGNDIELLEDKLIFEKIIESIRKEGDIELRAQLDGYLKKHLEKNSEPAVIRLFKKPITYFSIAASMALGMFFINFYSQDQGNTIILQNDPVPVKADSATYDTDTLNVPNKKNME